MMNEPVKKTSHVFAWILAAEAFELAATGLLIDLAVETGRDALAHTIAQILIWGFLAVRVVLLILDHRVLAANGIRISIVFYIAGFFITGLYLLARAASTDRRYGYFFFWLVPVVIFILTVIVFLMFFSHY